MFANLGGDRNPGYKPERFRAVSPAPKKSEPRIVVIAGMRRRIDDG